MGVIKAVLLATSILLLSGCGIYDRQIIKHECNEKGDIVLYVYKAYLVSADENITQAKFLTHQSILSDDNFEVTCKRISK